MSEKTTKLQFFEQLVVTGKVLEMLLLFASSYRAVGYNVAAHARRVHSYFEPLNLAAAYAANPANTKLDELAAAIAKYQASAALIFSVLGAGGSAARAKAVEDLFSKGAIGSLTGPKRNRVLTALTQFDSSLPERTQDIYKAIGYSPSIRQAWLNEQTTHNTPLTPRYRINKWRTLVRHRDWTACLHMLGASPGFKAALHNRFSSTSGIEAATVLWQALALAEPANEPSAADASPGALPAGVSVASTVGGQLEVRAVINPLTFLTGAGATKAVAEALAKGAKTKGVALPTKLVEQLAPRATVRTCSFQHLGAAVAEVTSWMKEASADAKDVCEQVQAWLHEVNLRAVKDKLKKHFTPSELQLLKQVFAEEAESPELSG